MAVDYAAYAAHAGGDGYGYDAAAAYHHQQQQQQQWQQQQGGYPQQVRGSGGACACTRARATCQNS
jgi:hypothetical protein